MPRWGKISGEYEVIFGFASGLLLFSGLLVWIFSGILPTIIGPFLAVFGALLMMDVAFPYGRQVHLLSEGVGLIASFIAVVSSAIFPGSIYWLIGLGLLLSVAKMIVRIYRKWKKPEPKVFKS